jgi:hypothetical protein
MHSVRRLGLFSLTGVSVGKAIIEVGPTDGASFSTG